MSIHRSLKTKSGSLASHRNVLKRAERIEKLALETRFDGDKNSPLGLAKVRSIKAVVTKKPKKAEGEGDAAAPAAGGKAAGGKAPAGKAPAGKAPAGKAPAGKAAAPAGKAAPAAKAPAAGKGGAKK